MMTLGRETGLLIRLDNIGEKSVKQASRKLIIRKYDPIVNQYVLFNETKLKK